MDTLISVAEEDETEENALKIIKMKLYRDLLGSIPIYEAFIKEKPKAELRTLDQVINAIS
jgi:hypothetical protein